MDDTFDLTLRTIVYRHFANTAESPALDAMCEATGATKEQVKDGYRRLYAKRMLVPADDFASIRMAPPFSGVPTQHRATVNGKESPSSCSPTAAQAWIRTSRFLRCSRPCSHFLGEQGSRIGLPAKGSAQGGRRCYAPERRSGAVWRRLTWSGKSWR